MNNISTQELVINPTKITKSIIIDSVLLLNKKQENIFEAKNFITRFKRDLKIKLYLKNDYLNYYKFLKNYQVPKLSSRGYGKIKDLRLEFISFYIKLIFNNFALAYIYSKDKQINNPVITAEDEKNIALSNYYNNKITINEFKKEFGQYALNAYELSEKRFREYDEEQLQRIAYLASGNKINKSIKLDNYLKISNKKIISVLICLRELAKYNSLKIVSEIRFELLGLAKERGVENIFDYNLDEIE